MTLRSVRAFSLSDKPLPEGSAQTPSLLANALIHGCEGGGC